MSFVAAQTDHHTALETPLTKLQQFKMHSCLLAVRLEVYLSVRLLVVDVCHGRPHTAWLPSSHVGQHSPRGWLLT
jgi:hypothetical protein